MPVTVELNSVDGNTKLEISAFTTNRVTGDMGVIDWNRFTPQWPHLQGINFPTLPSRPIVDLLIGMDNPDTNETDVYNLLRDFWEVEDYGASKSSDLPLSPIDKLVAQNTEKSLVHDKDHYEVANPWKQQQLSLPDNYDMALNRLRLTEKKLNKTPEVKAAYQETIDGYVDKGYLRRVDCTESAPQTQWFLPHFPVVKPERETTKVRIVFDASAKCKGVSLNDQIHQGPKLQNELFDVLMRFRKYPVAVVCDISEMYLRVGLSANDRPYHRFLWHADADPPEVYEFNSLVFGVNVSPFLAQFVSQKNAELYRDEYPMAAETVLKSTYMDDSMNSVPTEEMGIRMYQELSALWKKAGMFARKWLSNSTVLMQEIPESDRAKEVDLDTGYLPTTKTLGVLWKANSDLFTFKVTSHDCTSNDFTKRQLLRTVARIFDPIGLVSPFTIKGKMLLQELWCDGYDWDEPLKADFQVKVKAWFSGAPELNEVTVKRSLNFSVDAKATCLHVFVDASESAYSAVIYVRHELENGTVEVHFVCSKTRVAPLKAVSVPRLELMAAVLGLRLAATVTRTLQIDMSCVEFWSDSSNVLWWIHGQSRTYKAFVANRVGEIHELSMPSRWRHVPSACNPADVASRGQSAGDLVECSLWWSGPPFLQNSEDMFPKNEFAESDTADTELRKKSTFDTFVAYPTTDNSNDRLNPERYSSWIRLVRVHAWVMRFVNNCRAQRQDICSEPELSTCEIRDAEIILIRNAQQASYGDEYKCLVKGQQLSKKSRILNLNPRLDADGLVRADTRLKFANFLSYDARFPVILPRKSAVTKLIVKHYHELGHHGGTNQTLSSLSSRYWVEAAREEIRDWGRQCAYCKRLKGNQGCQIMAPLPDIRLHMPLRAFAHTAVDYAGPFLTIQGRGKSRTKRYLCLFTCLACRAVHLEISFGLDTDSFLNAFYRFASRRGLPVKMNSDNGTNFVGADRELKALVQGLDKQQIVRNTADRGVQWEFNPSLAPHFGGVHEIMVKSAKRAIYHILKDSHVTDEELITTFTGAEGLINSRPLAYQSSNPSDDVVLTPNHFLHGQAGGQFAPTTVDTTDFSPRRRWRHVQELVKHVWHRWMKEFLPTLSARKKWFAENRDFQVGDIVMVIDPDSPRGHWPLGKILEVSQVKMVMFALCAFRLGKCTETFHFEAVFARGSRKSSALSRERVFQESLNRAIQCYRK